VAGESLSGESEWARAGLSPGSLVAGYRVESRIGTGGMAMVLRATDENLGRTVALKILAPALAGDAEFRERFVRESRAVAAVDHPHIIPVYAAGQADGVLYLAMRFVAGGDLRSVLRREGPLPGERAVALLAPIASALDAAHAAGLVHRDVKPANILVDKRPARPEFPYLSDFGLAKGASSAAGLTGTGQFLGTPDYAAPEQISGKATGPQTDQYALACVAYTILTGSVPFARNDSLAVMWAQMYDPPPSLTASRPDLPAEAGEVIARALAKSPADRYATCSEFIEELRGALAAPTGAGSAAVGPVVSPAPESEPPLNLDQDQEPDQDQDQEPDQDQDQEPDQDQDQEPDQDPKPEPDQDPGPGSNPGSNSDPGSMGGDTASLAQQPGETAKSDLMRSSWPRTPDSWPRRHWGLLVTATVVLSLLLAGGGAVRLWLQGQYYVGVSNGYVAIFRGSNQSLAGISLSSLAATTPLPVSKLRASDQVALAQTIPQSSYSTAQQLIDSLQGQVEACGQQWKAVAAWRAENAKYQTELTKAKNSKGKIFPVGDNPGLEPDPPDAADCAPAVAFGIKTSSAAALCAPGRPQSCTHAQ
jgi:serine/threonine protein kinase